MAGRITGIRRPRNLSMRNGPFAAIKVLQLKPFRSHETSHCRTRPHLKPATLNTVAAAQIAGVSKPIVADSPSLAENVAAQVLAIASNYSHILFPSTANGKTSHRASDPACPRSCKNARPHGRPLAKIAAQVLSGNTQCQFIPCHPAAGL